MLKDLLLKIVFGAGFLGILFGYVNNIIFMFDHWERITFTFKFLYISGVFIPPLGAIFGLSHIWG